MASFKLCIADPKTGKCYQKEAKDSEAEGFIGLNVGENVKGDSFGMSGYEFVITGGSDYCGFPMRRDVQGAVRKRITVISGVGFNKVAKGIRQKKTVCGNTINDKIIQINLKVTKEGATLLIEEKAEEKPAASEAK